MLCTVLKHVLVGATRSSQLRGPAEPERCGTALCAQRRGPGEPERCGTVLCAQDQRRGPAEPARGGIVLCCIVPMRAIERERPVSVRALPLAHGFI